MLNNLLSFYLKKLVLYQVRSKTNPYSKKFSSELMLNWNSVRWLRFNLAACNTISMAVVLNFLQELASKDFLVYWNSSNRKKSLSWSVNFIVQWRELKPQVWLYLYLSHVFREFLDSDSQTRDFSFNV